MAMNDNNRVGEIVETYRLMRVLGSGSTSVVYLGQRLDDEHSLVAVKVLTVQDSAGSLVDHAAFRTRFLREARAASRLRHEHILQVLSYGEIDDLTYMVMPLVAGGTLAARISDTRTTLSLAEIAHLTRQLASALDYAHQQGIVHRDVKPSNVLIDEQGALYLTDFGIARLFDLGANSLTAGHVGLTHTGQVLGTPYYMAPEQIKGERVGPATDIYALGVVVYQMVTGQVPFQGDTPIAIAMQHLQDEPCPPSLLRSDLSPAAERAILRAMARQPADRFPTATGFADDLTQAVRGAESMQGSRRPVKTRPLDPAPLPPDDVAEPFRCLVGTTLGSYHLDVLREVSDLGSLFQARSVAEGTVYRLRVLAIDEDLPLESRSIFLGRFQQLAHAVAELQHPYIVPLIDYGGARGVPYLVSPYVAGQSLDERLRQTGPMELLAVGRALDRIAAALEYAHERGLLHRSLSTKCIVMPDLQESSDLAIADFEVRRMVELGMSPSTVTSSLYHHTDACAPEQLLPGTPVDTYTDVYALGVVLYAMLTGRPIYTGATKDDIAQQHLYAAVPSLRRWRSGLPVALENIVARALAKEPSLRFRRPAELSNAFRQIVGSASGSYTFGDVTAPDARPRTDPGAPPFLPGFSSESQPALVTPDGLASQTESASPSFPPAAADGDATTQSSVAHLPATETGLAPGDYNPATYRTTDPGVPHAPTEGRRPLSPAPPERDARHDIPDNALPPGPSSRVNMVPPVVAVPPPDPSAANSPYRQPFVPVVPEVQAPRRGGPAVLVQRRLPMPGMPWWMPVWVLYVGVGVILFALLLGMFIARNPHWTPWPGPSEYADAHFETPTGDVGYRANESLAISALALPDPPQGMRYAGWLANVVDANSEPKAWIRLGPLTKQQNEWTVTFTGSASTNLMSSGNMLEVIRESASAQPPLAPAPDDPVVLEGTYPATVYQHLQHLLVSWPDTPLNAGLLVAMRHQTYVLQGEAQALKEVAYRGDQFAVACHAQSVLDIIEGKPGGDYAALDPNCANSHVTDQVGDGYGYLGTSGQGNYSYEPYIQAVEYHMDKTVQALGNQTELLPELNLHAGHVHDAMEHVRGLLSAARQDALKLRQSPGASNAGELAGDLAATCDAALQWAHPDGAALDPTQFGVLDAYIHSQFAATLHLTPPSGI